MLHLYHCKALLSYDSTDFILESKYRLHTDTCVAYIFSAKDPIYLMSVCFGHSQNPASHLQ